MKTIETIKQDFKAATGKDMPIYTFEGKLGILYDSNGSGALDFIPMDEFLAKEDTDFELVSSVDVDWSCKEGEEIDEDWYVDEYDGHLQRHGWAPLEYFKSDKYVRELLVTTNRFNRYSWTSERKKMIDEIRTDLEDFRECTGIKKIMETIQHNIPYYKKDWENTCSKYEDPLGWESCQLHSVDFYDVLKEAVEESHLRAGTTKAVLLQLEKVYE